MRNRATTPLSKAKIRQSWSKYNLYNLSRSRDPRTAQRTFFQQKWTAKSLSRNYHGEQVRESEWERMFSRRLRSVVPMDPYKLARDDGSGMAAGRGSGLEKFPEENPTPKRLLPASRNPNATPYTHMTFAPLERRLDVAIFRALFASSTRQARQFVVHGSVTVNGKKMRYPGYLLNPGDMFQVDTERVMFATGAPKDKFERREGRVERKKAEAKDAEAEGEEAAAEEAKENESEGETKEAEEETLDTRGTLKTLLDQAKSIMTSNKDVLPAKRKQEIRGFQKAIRRVMSKSPDSSILAANLETQFAEIMKVLKAKKIETKEAKGSKKETKDSQKTETAPTTPEAKGTETAATGENKPTEALNEAFRQAAQNPEEELDTSELTDEEFEVLRHALVQLRDNPIDSTKPYATPWRPRDYMSAFAFVPRYLEVNHNICAAVYLRHPVARPGSSEVPTPFGENIATAAFSWYLRRR
ncbi:hypothetical protein BDW59DRAFT_150614 [Aspergillus cavernicola]|uniref:RNA-binding S4 domain-containing protein n=1 Tax=Aspergillus cavernicola TaxID=176166 RepID=A0ABR4HZB9_9EURO